MRRVVVSLVILAAFSAPVWAECSPFASRSGDYSTCTTAQRVAWIVTIPVWVPPALTYKLLGGEFGYERAEREESQRQAVAAWQRMTPEERQEAIQLMQLQQQQQQADSANKIRTLELLNQIVKPPPQGSLTNCDPNGIGGVTCTTRPW
jgi:hypothetical protein